VLVNHLFDSGGSVDRTIQLIHPINHPGQRLIDEAKDFERITHRFDG
jgi:hypothetical protein